MLRRIGLSLTACLVACRAGPDYHPPQMSTPDGFHEAATDGPADGLRLTPENLAAWWEHFEDPVLTDFVTASVEGNRSLASARARLREARALQVAEHGGRFPRLDATGEYERRRNSENTSQPSLGDVRELFAPGFDVSWELDVFGGKARADDAGRSEAQASAASYAATLVSLTSEVARTYIAVRRVEEQLRVAQRNLDAQRETLRAVMVREREGLTAELDVRRAETNVYTTESTIPVLRSNRSVQRARLATLINQPLAAVVQRLGAQRPVPTLDQVLVVGTPAELLRQRPDLREAERRLASAVNRIGAAEAELLPSFSLTGALTVESNDLDFLAQTSALSWSFGPSLRLPLFYRDRLRALVEAADARAEAAYSNYEQAVLLAIEEVESSLATWREERIRRATLDRAAFAASEGVRQARSAYDEGLTTFQTVLDAERSLLDLERQLAESDEVIATSAITLFKAFGGGLALAEKTPGRRRADLPWQPSASVTDTYPWIPRFEDRDEHN